MESQDSFGGTLAALRESFEAISRSAFLEEHAAPFLVRLTPETESAEVDASSLMMTNRLALNGASSGAAPGALECRVFELRKEHRNPFSEMITVGRAPNNDVVLADTSVSKFHAFVRSTPLGWILVDAQSSNGTFLGGAPLLPAHVYALDLASPASIRFGGVACQLLSPEGFWQLLSMLPIAASSAVA